MARRHLSLICEIQISGIATTHGYFGDSIKWCVISSTQTLSHRKHSTTLPYYSVPAQNSTCVLRRNLSLISFTPAVSTCLLERPREHLSALWATQILLHLLTLLFWVWKQPQIKCTLTTHCHCPCHWNFDPRQVVGWIWPSGWPLLRIFTIPPCDEGYGSVP